MRKWMEGICASRRSKVALLIVYTIVVIYFMFFGFDRPHIGSSYRAYRYSIIPAGIPLWFPKNLSLVCSELWLFSLGNLLAFVPFGILIPMIYELKYPKFIGAFMVSILLAETVQMVTYLGSFDVEDIIVNALGATIGFISYKIGNTPKLASRKIISTVFSVLLLSFLLIALAEVLD